MRHGDLAVWPYRAPIVQLGSRQGKLWFAPLVGQGKHKKENMPVPKPSGARTAVGGTRKPCQSSTAPRIVGDAGVGVGPTTQHKMGYQTHVHTRGSRQNHGVLQYRNVRGPFRIISKIGNTKRADTQCGWAMFWMSAARTTTTNLHMYRQVTLVWLDQGSPTQMLHVMFCTS